MTVEVANQAAKDAVIAAAVAAVDGSTASTVSGGSPSAASVEYDAQTQRRIVEAQAAVLAAVSVSGDDLTAISAAVDAALDAFLTTAA